MNAFLRGWTAYFRFGNSARLAVSMTGSSASRTVREARTRRSRRGC
ncbi:group II intron maturase-specific domain-containing protein [Streptomyces caelestis]